MKIPSIVKTIQKQPIQEINYAFHKTISYSQFSIYHECPHKWKLQYKDSLQEHSSTIHTVFVDFPSLRILLNSVRTAV